MPEIHTFLEIRVKILILFTSLLKGINILEKLPSINDQGQTNHVTMPTHAGHRRPVPTLAALARS